MLIPRSAQDRRWQMIVATSIGNAFEWYDFVVFGYFALAIGKQFFPGQDSSSALLSSLATFGVAFVMRPLGAIVLGHYADRYGRKPALTLAIFLMTAGTLLIAISPTPASVGFVAPLIIIVLACYKAFRLVTNSAVQRPSSQNKILNTGDFMQVGNLRAKR